MFEPDELAGFEKTTFELPAEDDGELVATLVRTVGREKDDRPAVLYVHGFVDYFFQVHVAKAFEESGYRFYAIDLRRYGRSIRPGNRACMAWDVADYFVELDRAVETIGNAHPHLAAIVAHSTGGLIASLYLAARSGKTIARSLVLISPFLRFHLAPWDRGLSIIVAKAAKFMPALQLPRKLNAIYGRSIHVSEQGEWDYSLEKKPLAGFPLYAGWFGMIRAAHRRIRRGLHLGLPILTLHSDKTRIPGRVPSPRDLEADLVLNVRHIKALSLRLGKEVTVKEIAGGVHDLTLSKKPVRDATITAMIDFVRFHDHE